MTTVKDWESQNGKVFPNSAPCYVLDEGKYHLMSYLFGVDFDPELVFVATCKGVPESKAIYSA